MFAPHRICSSRVTDSGLVMLPHSKYEKVNLLVSLLLGMERVKARWYLSLMLFHENRERVSQK